ncbi:hypothetical protein P5F52_10415 [Clostridium perfringens]|uniref:hypothetical protein n=1 Tax=Clostridium perfringens TaxID=1502 RepID=UPI00285FF706|nr:hypothetical protein [Clostridium perfringens]MDK0919211.1 hypothetical protein [Clostridium perfringens]
MNELQEKAIKKLCMKNEKYIDEVIVLQEKIDSDYKAFSEFKDEFWDCIDKMEKANSNVPFLPYCNLYCIKNGEFSIPIRSCFKDSIYGTVNEEYELLSPEYMEKKEKKMEFNSQKIKKILCENAKIIDELLDKVIASNSITKRLSGLEDKLNELEQQKNLFWYSKELSRQKYSYTGSILVPPCVHNVQLVLPFHRRLVIKNEYLFKTMPLHLQILKNIKAILLYINEFLPFAELIL